MYFESLIVTRATTMSRVPAVAIALLAFFSTTLSASMTGTEPAAPTVECVSSPGGSVSMGVEINSIDQTGRRWELHEQKGRLFIVSFLVVVPDTAPSPSRAQVVGIQSMETQYGRLGVDAVVIDESRLIRKSESSRAERINAWYDWHLDPISLLADEDSSIAKAFDVCSMPTTFLVDSSGRVVKRWDSMVNAGGLAQEIQAVLRISQTKTGTSKHSSLALLPSRLR